MYRHYVLENDLPKIAISKLYSTYLISSSGKGAVSNAQSMLPLNNFPFALRTFPTSYSVLSTCVSSEECHKSPLKVQQLHTVWLHLKFGSGTETNGALLARLFEIVKHM